MSKTPVSCIIASDFTFSILRPVKNLYMVEFCYNQAKFAACFQFFFSIGGGHCKHFQAKMTICARAACFRTLTYFKSNSAIDRLYRMWSLQTTAPFTLYWINFHSNRNICECLLYSALLPIELILSLQKEVLTAVIWNIFKTTISVFLIL